MIILDKPYVSRLLEATIAKHKIPALKRDGVALEMEHSIPLLTTQEFFCRLNEMNNPSLYIISEDSLPLIYNYLNNTKVIEKINVFKDKHKFRFSLQSVYPNFYFKKIDFSEIENVISTDLKFPLVLKPTIGFASVGVYKIDGVEQWQQTIKEIKHQVPHFHTSIVSFDCFIIEEYVAGDEYAVDAYFNGEGRPVIINIMKHPFNDHNDTSDRLYYTSRQIIKEMYESAVSELKKMGSLLGLKNFPVHAEFRMSPDSRLIPIEVNPLRFIGWCTSELAFHAFGINPHEYFFLQKEPNWDEILKNCDDSYYCIGCGVIPNGVDPRTIKDIKYEKFASLFGETLELVKVDFKKYPEFGYVFSKFEGGQQITQILKKDFNEYIMIRESHGM